MFVSGCSGWGAWYLGSEGPVLLACEPLFLIRTLDSFCQSRFWAAYLARSNNVLTNIK